MMIDVLQARFRAEQAQATDHGDRGSELGDFDNELFDTEPNCTDCIELLTLDDEHDYGVSTLSGAG